MFRRWQSQITRYLKPETIQAVKDASRVMKELADDGTRKRLMMHCNFLKNNDIDRARPKRARIYFRKLNPMMYRRIMRERNGIGTVAKTVEWLWITFDKLKQRSWGNAAQRRYVEQACRFLDQTRTRLDASPVGYLFRTTNSGRVGNAIGQRFEDTVHTHERMLRRLMCRNSPDTLNDRTELYYNCNLVRRGSNGKNVVLRELDIVGINPERQICFWGEIKSNPYDVTYKARMQFYRFIQAFSQDCRTCRDQNMCRCETFIRTKDGQQFHHITSPWLFDIDEVASLHGLILTKVPKWQLPIPSDLGHTIMPIFYNFLAEQACAETLRHAAHSIEVLMSKYKDTVRRPAPAVVMVQPYDDESGEEPGT